MLGALDFEILGQEANWDATSRSSDGIANRALDVQVERVAELVRLGGELTFVTDA